MPSTGVVTARSVAAAFRAGRLGRVKVDLALARGRKLHDKRDAIKERSWDRERARLMREKG